MDSSVLIGTSADGYSRGRSWNSWDWKLATHRFVQHPEHPATGYFKPL